MRHWAVNKFAALVLPALAPALPVEPGIVNLLAYLYVAQMGAARGGRSRPRAVNTIIFAQVAGMRLRWLCFFAMGSCYGLDRFFVVVFGVLYLWLFG